MNNGREKNLYIEAAKVIGIVLVVLGHSFGAGLFAAKLYHMPLFFVISGLTLNAGKDRKLSEFVVGKIKRLYIPFLVYEAVFLCLNALLADIGLISLRLEGVEGYVRAIAHILLFDNYSLILSPIWFLTALFFSIILAFVVVKGIGNLSESKSKEAIGASTYKVQVLILVIGIVLVYLGLLLGEKRMFDITSSYAFNQMINVVIEATGYVLIGWALKSFLNMNSLTRIISIMLFAGVIVFERITRIQADMRSNEYDMVVIQPVLAIIGIAGVFAVSEIAIDFIEKMNMERVKAVVCFVANHTLAVMCLHIAVFKFIGLIQVKLFSYDSSRLCDWQIVDPSLKGLIIISAAGLMVPLIGCYFLDRVKEKR